MESNSLGGLNGPTFVDMAKEGNRVIEVGSVVSVEAVESQFGILPPVPKFRFGELVRRGNGVLIVQDEIKLRLGDGGSVGVSYWVQRLENFLAGVEVFGWEAEEGLVSAGRPKELVSLIQARLFVVEGEEKLKVQMGMLNGRKKVLAALIEQYKGEGVKLFGLGG